MLVNELMEKYRQKVHGPWTPDRLRYAGYDPSCFLDTVWMELQKCEDITLDMLFDAFELIGRFSKKTKETK